MSVRVRRRSGILEPTRLEKLILWPPYRGKLRVARTYTRLAGLDKLAGVMETPLGQLELDTRDHEDWALLFGGMEQRTIRWLLEQPRTGLAFDIGAHHGVYSVALAQIADFVVAVEPFPDSAEIARRNLTRNDVNGVVVEAAISDHSGGATLLLSSDGTPYHSLVNAVNESGETLDVPTMTLDALAEEYGTPGVVKLDVQWGEYECFLGARRLLERRETVCLFESEIWDSRRELVHELLRSCGYRLSSLDRGRERPGTEAEMLLARPAC